MARQEEDVGNQVGDTRRRQAPFQRMPIIALGQASGKGRGSSAGASWDPIQLRWVGGWGFMEKLTRRMLWCVVIF